jgi:ribosomal protein S18 acetylase RimI-like enzyme
VTFHVVPTNEEHIESFRTSLDSVARERRYLTFLDAPSLQETRRFVRRNIREGYPQCVALVEEKVVGWCDALRIDRPIRAHTGVLGIGVLAEFRGRGIGTALLRETLQKARASGLARIELSVREGNARVVGLYERFGFVQEGVQRKAIRMDGKYENLICMGLLLD